MTPGIGPFVIMQHQCYTGHRYMYGQVYDDIREAVKMVQKLNRWDNPTMFYTVYGLAQWVGMFD